MPLDPSATAAGARADRDNSPRASAAKAWAISTGLKCTVCNETESDWRSLWTHMRTHDPSPDDSEVIKDDSSGLLQCLVCGYQTGSKQLIRRHFSAHTTWRAFQCNMCQKSSKTAQNFLDHLVQRHGQMENTVYRCDKCDYSTTRKHMMRPHKYSAHSGTERCEVCFKQIKKRWLPNHYFLHTEERPYSCEMCDKTFSFRSHLRRHLESRHLNRTYDCNVCGKSFKYQHRVVPHIRRVHTNEPSHICCVCSKPFFCNSDYVKHVAKVHIGERNHKCTVCGKGFFSKVEMQNHVVVHTGEKQFSCGVCGKAFAFKFKVKDHMKTHGEERPFKCDLCGEAFKWKHNLASHMRAKHT